MIHPDDSIDVLLASSEGNKVAELDGYGLRIRSYNILRREGIHFVHQLLTLKPVDVYDMRNAGEHTVVNIVDLQPRIQAQLGQRPAPSRGFGETGFVFAVRILQWEGWWRAHDDFCSAAVGCTEHHSPYDTAAA